MDYYKYISDRLQPLANGVLKDFTSQAADMYEEAVDYTNSKYNTRIARNALPYNRHWLANERIHDLAMNYEEEDIKLKIIGNGRNSFYTILKQNNVVLTVSQVSTSGEKVRNSKFRNRLVNQFGVNLSLFEPQPVLKIPSDDEIIYGIILHGPISSKDQSIGFVNIAVPDENYEEYPYNECLFEMCGLEHPFKLSEEPMDKKQKSKPIVLKKKKTGK